MIGASVDSQFSHLAWINTPRKKGGLGEMKIPLLSDLTKSISRDYGVLLENAGISLRLVHCNCRSHCYVLVALVNNSSFLRQINKLGLRQALLS